MKEIGLSCSEWSAARLPVDEWSHGWGSCAVPTQFSLSICVAFAGMVVFCGVSVKQVL